MAVLFDTETSGLISNRTVRADKLPHVIEFYACVADVSTSEIVSEMDTLVNPPIQIEDKTTEITGITKEMLASAPKFVDIVDEVIKIISSASVAIAHNLSFDKEVLDVELMRLGRTVAWPERLVCCVEATVHLKGYRMTLSELHEYLFGQPFAGAHRAKTDVMAMLRCATELHRRGMI